jgi:hypothetical protein
MNELPTSDRVGSAGRPVPRIWIIVIAVLLIIPFGGQPAQALVSPYWCVWAGCKYGMASIEYTSTTTIYMRARGGTASQTCDPSNDVRRWRHRVVHTKASYSGPTGVWYANCNVYTSTKSHYLNISYTPPNSSALFYFTYETVGGALWYDNVFFYDHSIDNVYRSVG